MEKKRYCFIKLLVLAAIAICSTTAMYAQFQVTSLKLLKAGDKIRIYPKNNDGTSNYGNNNLALACCDDGKDLTSREKAGSGETWTLVDAPGKGFYYLKNNLGCYWAYQDNSPSMSLKCTKSKNSAVEVTLTWDSRHGGVCFWNKKDGRGLNNLNGANDRYNWYSLFSSYYYYTNTTFDVANLSLKEITNNGIKYLLYDYDKTAIVWTNNYSGDIVIPSEVTYNNDTYKVTSLGDYCFSKCRSLTSVTLPDGIKSLGDYCFEECSSLTSVTLPDGIKSLGDDCFSGCSSLTSVTLPNRIDSLGEKCFSLIPQHFSLTLFIIS